MYTFCHQLESPHGGDSNGMPQCLVLMERYKNIHQVPIFLSEPRLSFAYVNVLKIRYCLMLSYILALYVLIANIAKIK